MPTHTGAKTEVLPEAHGRSTEQHEPPENLQKKAMENDRGEAFGYGPTALRPPQCAIPFLPHRLPLFYSSRREAVYIALTHINSLSFRTEIPLDPLPTRYYYLGSDLCTYLPTLYNNVHAHV